MKALWGRARPEVALPILGLLAFLSPMLLTHRSFGIDWTNHLWLVKAQAEAIHQLGHPSRFIGADQVGAMYPHYAFYGSTWYSFVGLLAVELGGRVTVVYVLSYGLAFAGAWLGWWWLARELGVRGWAAHAPALVFSFAAFRMTVAFSGAYSEYVAAAAIPLVAAAGVHLLRAERIRARVAFALIAGTTWMTGTHNITLVWGSLVLVLVAVVAIVALPRHGREVPRERILAVLGLAVLGLLINAWFLVPDLTYAGRVRADVIGYDALKGAGKPLNDPLNILDPIYRDPIKNGIPHLYVQLPVLALAWSLVVAALWRRGPGLVPWRRAYAGLFALLVLLIVIIAGDDTWIWQVLPKPLRFVQYPHRLNNYTALIATALVLVALAGMARAPAFPRRKLAYGALGVVCAILAVAGTWQGWSTPSTLPDRGVVAATPVSKAPGTWYDPGLYRDWSAPVVKPLPPKDRVARFPVTPDTWTGFAGPIDVPPGGAPFRTNLGAGDYFVTVAGLRRVGRDDGGFAIMERLPGAAQTGPVAVKLSLTHRLPTVAGTAITLLALLGAFGLLAWLTWRARAGTPARRPVAAGR